MDKKAYKQDWETKYREENGSSYCNDWRDRDRERFLSKRRERITCECGVATTRGHLWDHRQTINHKDRLAEKLPSTDAVLAP